MTSFSTPFTELASQEAWVTLDEAERALKTAAEKAGFGVRRQRSSNPDAFGEPTSISYCCTRGGARKAYTTKTNKATSSSYCGCLWSGVLTLKRADRPPPGQGPRPPERSWRFRIVRDRSAHNHAPSDRANAIPTNRRRQRETFEKDLLALAADPDHSGPDVADILMQMYPGSVVTGHDVQNARRRVRQQQLENPSDTPEGESAAGPKDGGKCRRCGCKDPLGVTLKEKEKEKESES